MEAHQLLKAGRLADAISALHQHLAANPFDYKAQTFLFELICFTGDFDGAEHQLRALDPNGHPYREEGIARYRAVLSAERQRQTSFADRRYPDHFAENPSTAFTGRLNGKDFQTLSDADPRIGARLEVFAAGEYLWIGLSDIRRLQLPAPRRLRDLLWLPVDLTVEPSVQTLVFHDIWLPMMTPLTWQHADEEVKLGRVSDWHHNEYDEVVPFGIKTFLVDGVEMPLAEIRELSIHPPGPTWAA